jgi:hypothetical protein
MTNLIDRNDKFFTVHNKRSKISPPTSMYLATPVQRSDSNRSISVNIQTKSQVHMNFLSSQQPILSPPTVLNFPVNHLERGGADKSVAQPRRKQATANKLMIYSTLSPRSSTHFLARCSNFCKPLKKSEIGRAHV